MDPRDCKSKYIFKPQKEANVENISFSELPPPIIIIFFYHEKESHRKQNLTMQCHWFYGCPVLCPTTRETHMKIAEFPQTHQNVAASEQKGK